MTLARRQRGWALSGLPRPSAWAQSVERWLEAERDQIALWLPVALGLGIGLYFGLGQPWMWSAAMASLGGAGAAATALGRGGRLASALGWGAIVAMLGLGLAWGRSERVAAPVLSRAIVTEVRGAIVEVDRLPAREQVRLLVATAPTTGLPPQIRLSVDDDKAQAGLEPGASISVRARLVPPPAAAVPGAYDFARVAWFRRIGATGKALDPPTVTRAPAYGGFWRWLAAKRTALTRHIQDRLTGSTGGVAAAFVTGDTGAITQEDADAMCRSGLAHLLSISGLHVAAAIGATMFLTLKLLALSERLALHWPLHLIAAGAGALAGIAYTLLSGAEVPTVRSCVAAMIVLAGLALGREAMTLRLVAVGALVVLLFRPEALVGPSFQLSFAAVTAIVALHDHPRVRAWTLKRDEGLLRRFGRALVSLLLTGIVVEAVLAPIGLYHFHKAGLYGAFANIVAIPLTTFVIMPAEALALLLDLVGVGAPIWWVAGQALGLLLWLARTVSALPGSVAALPSMPLGAFLAMVAGGLWLMLWRAKARRLGLVPLAIGALWATTTPAPDLLVTDDGRHLAIRADDGRLYLLRPRAGDYVRDVLGTGAGVQEEALDLDAMPGARCSRDACTVAIHRGGRTWRLLALRSRYRIDWQTLTNSCAWSDIAVADRRLPRACVPKWLKLDAPALRASGGIAISLVRSATFNSRGGDGHPWVTSPFSKSTTYTPPHDDTTSLSSSK
ncbi:ComEC/Rec2 family competence protein [Sphingomonas sp. BIUV-7]|uniref:ComEC/Rec2 family competence protein n=1 Tax=Sphingomonas natans TaxID=3063330 RepID=A0ABT8Y503_9SPHN|nr:ComEC/Rec2 family competence protein [Sphingomonas sp. BIUV-7]MDO6413410.1 ComEC/Rec2 family competence protein [Sphingomonas sp. BIUV-7]